MFISGFICCIFRGFIATIDRILCGFAAPICRIFCGFIIFATCVFYSIRSVDELREFKKYVIYTNGYQSGTLDIGWQKNDEGYWYNCGNGVYPIKEWKEIDGKFYYFNYDGYMSFNMWTEDGYYVDENGAWIPGYDEELIDNAVIDYTRYYYDENGVIIKEEFSVPVSKASDINNLYNNFAENEYPKISRSAALTFNSKAHMQKLLDMMGEDHTMRPGF